MWAWLIGALALGLVVSPILALLPSKQQRANARLRTRAAHMGLRVRLESMTAASAKDSGEILPVYTLPWLTGEDAKLGKQAPWFLVRVKYAHDIHAFHDWDWASNGLKGNQHWRQALARLLSEAQGDPLYQRLAGLEWSSHGVHLYWREGSDEADVERVASLLKGLRDFGRDANHPPVWPTTDNHSAAD